MHCTDLPTVLLLAGQSRFFTRCPASRVPLNHGNVPLFVRSRIFFFRTRNLLRCRGAPTLMQITQLNVIDFCRLYTSKKISMWAMPTVPLFAGKSRFFTRNVPLKTFSRLAGLTAVSCVYLDICHSILLSCHWFSWICQLNNQCLLDLGWPQMLPENTILACGARQCQTLLDFLPPAPDQMYNMQTAAQTAHTVISRAVRRKLAPSRINSLVYSLHARTQQLSSPFVPFTISDVPQYSGCVQIERVFLYLHAAVTVNIPRSNW